MIENSRNLWVISCGIQSKTRPSLTVLGAPSRCTTLMRIDGKDTERSCHTFNIHQCAELNLAWVVVLAVYCSCSEDEI